MTVCLTIAEPCRIGHMSILHLKGWEVIDTHDKPEGYVIDARYSLEPTACVNCNTEGKLYKHGTKTQEIADTPIHGKKALVNLTRARYRCQACLKTFVFPIPDLHDTGTMTKRLVGYIEAQSFRRTFIGIAEDVGVSEGTVRNVFDDYVDYLDRTVTFETPEVLGIDETHLLHDMRCVLVNVKKGTFFDVLEDRNKPTVTQRLFWMPDKERVKLVTIDIWRPYRDAVRAVLPDAQVVVDKFHVVRMAGSALETIRKSLGGGMNTGERRRLMRSRYLILWRRKKLTDEQREIVAKWSEEMPLLGAAYKAKEDFFELYDEAGDQATARDLYARWKADLPDALKPAFKPLTTAMGNWEPEIFAYFDHRVTNAITEALNGVAKVINKTGRGYSFKVIRAKMLYSKHPRGPVLHHSAAPLGDLVSDIVNAPDIEPLTREEAANLPKGDGVDAAEFLRRLEGIQVRNLMKGKIQWMKEYTAKRKK